MKLSVYITLGALILLGIAQLWINQDAMHDHEEFFREVRTFMNAGGRNTAEQGKERDERLRRIEDYLGLESQNATND